MILIVANSEDSLLYLKTLLRNSEEVSLAQKYKTYVGKISGQDVCLVASTFSSYASEFVTTALIQRYQPYLVIYLGDVMALSDGIKPGNIFLTNHVIYTDLDQTERDSRMRMFDLPILHNETSSGHYLSDNISKVISSVTIKNAIVGTIASSNRYVTKSSELRYKKEDLEALVNGPVALDSEFGGVSIACHMYDVALIGVTTVSCTIDNPRSMVERTRVILRGQVELGKALASYISRLNDEEAVFIRKW